MSTPRHLHPKVKLVWFLPTVIGLLVVWLVVATVLFLAQPDVPVLGFSRVIFAPLLLLFMLVFIGGPVYAYHHIEYMSFTYELAETEFIIRQGVFTRDTIVIPYNRIGFSLIRVYREQITNETQNTAGSELLSQLKWPIEYMFVGLQPAWNTSVIVNTTAASTVGTSTTTVSPNPTFQSPSTAAIGNLNAWRDWHRMSRQVDAQFTGYIGGLGGALDIMQYGLSPERYWLPVSTADSLSLVAHGITIYDTFQDLFFSSYLPYNYGGAALNTPNDQGAFFINFALFPRSYQPSGHLNISRARETYLNWTTQYVSSNSSVYLIVVAVAINFLLISDGSAVLRYST